MYEINYEITWQSWVIIYKNTWPPWVIIYKFAYLLHPLIQHFMARQKLFHPCNFFMDFQFFFYEINI